AAGEQEIGEVGAGDKQQQAAGGEGGVERGTGLGAGKLGDPGNDDGRAAYGAVVVVGKIVAEGGMDTGKVRGGFGDGDAGVQAADGPVTIVAAVHGVLPGVAAGGDKDLGLVERLRA